MMVKRLNLRIQIYTRPPLAAPIHYSSQGNTGGLHILKLAVYSKEVQLYQADTNASDVLRPRARHDKCEITHPGLRGPSSECFV